MTSYDSPTSHPIASLPTTPIASLQSTPRPGPGHNVFLTPRSPRGATAPTFALQHVAAFLRRRCGTLEDAFYALDFESVGSLTLESFAQGMERLGHNSPLAETTRVFHAMDESASGSVRLQAFLAVFDEDDDKSHTSTSTAFNTGSSIPDRANSVSSAIPLWIDETAGKNGNAGITSRLARLECRFESEISSLRGLCERSSVRHAELLESRCLTMERESSRHADDLDARLSGMLEENTRQCTDQIEIRHRQLAELVETRKVPCMDDVRDEFQTKLAGALASSEANLEQRLTEEVQPKLADALASSEAKLEQRLASSEAKLEQRLTNEVKTVTQQLMLMQKESQQCIDAAEKKYNDARKSMEQQLVDVRAATASQLEASMDEVRDDFQPKLADAVANSEAKLEQRLTDALKTITQQVMAGSLANSEAKLEQRLASSEAKLEQRLTDEVKTVNQQVNLMHKDSQQRIDVAEKEQRLTEAKLEQRLTDALKTFTQQVMADAVANSEAKLEQRLTEEVKQRLTREVQPKLADSLASSETKLEQRLASSEAKLEQRLTDALKTVTQQVMADAVANSEAKLEQRLASSEAKLEQRLTDEVKTVNQQVNLMQKDSQQRIDVAEKEYNDGRKSMEQQLDEVRVATASQLEASMDEVKGDFEAKLASAFASSEAQLEQRLASSQANLEQSVTEEVKTVKQQVIVIQRDSQQCVDAAEKKYNDARKSMEQQLVEVRAATATVKEEVNAFTQQIKLVQSESQQRVDAAEKKFTDAGGATEQQLVNLRAATAKLEIAVQDVLQGEVVSMRGELKESMEASKSKVQSMLLDFRAEIWKALEEENSSWSFGLFGKSEVKRPPVDVQCFEEKLEALRTEMQASLTERDTKIPALSEELRQALEAMREFVRAALNEKDIKMQALVDVQCFEEKLEALRIEMRAASVQKGTNGPTLGEELRQALESARIEMQAALVERDTKIPTLGKELRQELEAVREEMRTLLMEKDVKMQALGEGVWRAEAACIKLQSALGEKEKCSTGIDGNPNALRSVEARLEALIAQVQATLEEPNIEMRLVAFRAEIEALLVEERRMSNERAQALDDTLRGDMDKSALSVNIRLKLEDMSQRLSQTEDRLSKLQQTEQRGQCENEAVQSPEWSAMPAAEERGPIPQVLQPSLQNTLESIMEKLDHQCLDTLTPDLKELTSLLNDAVMKHRTGEPRFYRQPSPFGGNARGRESHDTQDGIMQDDCDVAKLHEEIVDYFQSDFNQMVSATLEDVSKPDREATVESVESPKVTRCISPIQLRGQSAAYAKAPYPSKSTVAGFQFQANSYVHAGRPADSSSINSPGPLLQKPVQRLVSTPTPACKMPKTPPALGQGREILQSSMSPRVDTRLQAALPSFPACQQFIQNYGATMQPQDTNEASRSPCIESPSPLQTPMLQSPQSSAVVPVGAPSGNHPAIRAHVQGMLPQANRRSIGHTQVTI